MSDFELAVLAFNLRHSHETGNIKCRFDGCDEEYTKVNSFVKHVWNKHRVYLSHCGSDLESDCFSGKYILQVTEMFHFIGAVKKVHVGMKRV